MARSQIVGGHIVVGHVVLGRHLVGHTLGALAALVVLAAGCSSVGAHAHNLDALHSDDGIHHLKAALYGNFEWEFRQAVSGLLPDSAIAVKEKQADRLDDPCQECLENLIELQGTDAKDDYQASLQVQQFARWAVECPWALSRERSVKALVGQAKRLELAQHAPGPLQGDPVGPEELGDALAQLVAAVRPALTEDLALDLGALAAACERLRGLAYDLDGARRATALVSLLARGAPADDQLFDPLHELHVELQRLTVQRALSAALLDRSPFERSGSHSGWGNPRVQAAAVNACVRSLGPTVLAELLVSQLDPSQSSEVLLALVREVTRLGEFPLEQEQLSAEERAFWGERWVEAFVVLATSHPDGRLRVAAMRALSRVTGSELESLREEDWQTWYEDRQAVRAAGAAEGGAS